MSNVQYDGGVVESVVDRLSQISNKIPGISSGVRSATNKIVSAYGFQKYIGGISSDAFSSVVDKCQDQVRDYSNYIRQKQVSVLAYSKDQGQINAFLDRLNRNDYEALDLTELDPYIGFGRRVGNFFSGVGSTVATFGLGLFEGIGNLFETGADLIVLGASGAASIFTGAADWITGGHLTSDMWEETRAFVSDKKVENIFNSFYNDTDIGQSLKNNAYGFGTARSIGSGLGYTAGLIAVNVLTGGAASGLGVGAAGSISAGQLAVTAGLLGFSSGTEDAWNDGATTGAGLLHGVANGVWTAAQWYTGAKINQYGGLGDKIAQGIFKGAAKGVGTRIAMDTGFSALEGFVRPALNMIYKDYGKGSFIENYKTAFTAVGGWGNVGTNALMGGIASGVGEYFGARRLLKAANAGDDASDAAAKELFQSDGGDGSSEITTTLKRNVDELTEENGKNVIKLNGLDEELSTMDNELLAKTKIPNLEGDLDGKTIFAESVDGGNGGATREVLDQLADDGKVYGTVKKQYTIDGKEVVENDSCIFKHSDGRYVNPSLYQQMDDGSFLPLSSYEERFFQKGSLESFTETMRPSQAMELLEQNRDFLSSTDYSRLKGTIEVFSKYDCDVSMNELKLIAFHSEGTEFRVGKALYLSHEGLDNSVRISMTDDICQKLFKSDFTSYGETIKKTLLIDEFQLDDWRPSKEIYTNSFNSRAVKAVVTDSTTVANRISVYLPDNISDETVQRLLKSDGYFPNIREILSQDSAIAEEALDYYSTRVAGKVFKSENLARLAASKQAYYGNVDVAVDLLRNSDDILENYNEVFRATSLFSEKGNRNAYYSCIDTLGKNGDLNADSLFTVKSMNAKALTETGTLDVMPVTKVDITDSSSLLFNYKNLATADAPMGDVEFSQFTKNNYMNADGTINTTKLSDDFTRVINRNSSVDVGLGSLENAQSRQVYIKNFTDAVSDSNNPGQAEAVRMMSKIVELDEAGTPLTVVANKEGAFYSPKTNTISLDTNTISGNIGETIDHESGHMVYHNLLNKVPESDFEDFAYEVSTKNIKSTAQLDMDTLDTLRANYKEIEYYSEWRAEQIVDERIRASGYSSVSEYVDTLEYRLGDRNAAWNTYQEMVEDVTDKINRVEFFTDTNTCAMVNSVSNGEVLIGYGHSKKYFTYYSDGAERSVLSRNLLSFDESLAQFTAFKMNGNTRGLQLVKQILGDEMYDLLDDAYETMLLY